MQWKKWSASFSFSAKFESHREPERQPQKGIAERFKLLLIVLEVIGAIGLLLQLLN